MRVDRQESIRRSYYLLMESWFPRHSFVRGVNLPWLSYGNDFGANAWHPEGGITAGQQRDNLDQVFRALAASGARLSRWFLLCDGRAGLCEDDEGGLAGLDEHTFHDLQTAVTAAEAHGVGLIPVLLDFHWCHPARTHAGVTCGGRAHDLVDAGRRAHLLHHVLRPLLARFGARSGIAAWDLINEPDWVTFSWQSWDPLHALLPDVMCSYIAEAAALVHECTMHPATVGLATAASLPHVRGLGLDLLQVHWYDRLEDLAPLATPVETWGMDVPIILGEFPTRGSARAADEIEDIASEAGYAGALAWSLRAGDAASDPDAVWHWLSESPVPRG